MLDYKDYMTNVSENKRDLFIELTTGTDSVCDLCLDDEYRELCRELTADIICKGRFAFKGKLKSWVSGIVQTVGWINFLTDPTQPCYMTTKMLAQNCGVSHSTMMDKSMRIRKYLQIAPMDPRWCRFEILLDNPRVWMVKVDGFIIDIRSASRDLQIAAYEQGVIPFIPPEHVPQLQEKEQEESQEPANKSVKKKIPIPNGTLSLFDQTNDSSDD